MASAAARILASLMSHPKVFQLFQPNGGRTAGLPGAAEAGETGGEGGARHDGGDGTDEGTGR